MSRSRKEVMADALKAEIGAASVDLKTLFTDNVVGWSPYATVSGLATLADLAALREEAFSNVVSKYSGDCCRKPSDNCPLDGALHRERYACDHECQR